MKRFFLITLTAISCISISTFSFAADSSPLLSAKNNIKERVNAHLLRQTASSTLQTQKPTYGYVRFLNVYNLDPKNKQAWEKILQGLNNDPNINGKFYTEAQDGQLTESRRPDILALGGEYICQKKYESDFVALKIGADINSCKENLSNVAFSNNGDAYLFTS